MIAGAQPNARVCICTANGKAENIRMSLAIGPERDYEIYMRDVITVFLNAGMEEKRGDRRYGGCVQAFWTKRTRSVTNLS